MNTQPAAHSNKRIHKRGSWQRLMILLLILLLALVACGGGDGDDNSGTPDNQSQNDDGDQDDFTVVPTDAMDKGTIELGQTVEDEITNAGERHSYRFEGQSGDSIVVHINATGSAFTSPYAFLYGPDDALIGNSNTSAASRSSRVRHTLTADGTYTVIVRPIGNIGIEPYAVSVEKEE